MPDPVPDSSSRTTPAGGPVVEYVTRLVTLTNLSAETVLPYVREVIRTVGLGSAVVAGDKDLQLTLPVQLLHFLEATIKQFDDRGNHIEEFAENTFYPPLIRVKGPTGSLKPAVDALGICPPDMRVAWVELGEAEGALLVSGPGGARADHYREHVLPNLKALVLNLNPRAALPPQ